VAADEASSRGEGDRRPNGSLKPKHSMPSGTVTVAIPVRNGGLLFARTLEAVKSQQIDREVELLVVDSGSTDGSLELARSSGATVKQIPAKDFSHGATRNLMMSIAAGEHVAFLSQDAIPAASSWLSNLIEGFEIADDVALVFGPYIPRPESSPMVKRELIEFFSALSEGGQPNVHRASAEYRRSPGPLTFFSDANGAVARWAWESVQFRDVPYAEDQLLAAEMIEAGYAKVFHPGAGVLHSHDYSTGDYFRRCFDEWRALREVHGHVESASPKRIASRLVREVRADRDYMRNQGPSGVVLMTGTLRSFLYHLTRAFGSVTGSRANRFPAFIRRRLSLEGRS
jgi:glycosyltransferase involved in cell wall biosynthesis